jgi:phosphoribosylamine-glycine ligase
MTAVASTFAGAQAASLAAAREVSFDGKHFRDDIGWRERARSAARA